MRLIDADKIIFHEIDEIGGEYEPYLGCSKSQIDSLPSVTPQEPILDKIKKVVAKWKADSFSDGFSWDCMQDIAAIIDKTESEEV